MPAGSAPSRLPASQAVPRCSHSCGLAQDCPSALFLVAGPFPRWPVSDEASRVPSSSPKPGRRPGCANARLATRLLSPHEQPAVFRVCGPLARWVRARGVAGRRGFSHSSRPCRRAVRGSRRGDFLHAKADDVGGNATCAPNLDRIACQQLKRTSCRMSAAITSIRPSLMSGAQGMTVVHAYHGSVVAQPRTGGGEETRQTVLSPPRALALLLPRSPR